MGTSIRPDPQKARISRNVDKMLAQHAPESDIEEYLKSEGLSPVGSGNIDLRTQQESTRVSPRQQSAPVSGAGEGIADRLLNSATFGLHRKGLGVTQAIVDVVTHGTKSHPVDTYKQSIANTDQRMRAAEGQYPTASTAADAVGFFAPMATGLPAVRAALGLPEAASVARAPGFVAAAKRVGKSAATSAGLGAAATGLASTSPMDQRSREMVTGGLLASILGGGASAASESGGYAARKLAPLFQSASTKGEQRALAKMANTLIASGVEPIDLLERSKQAQATGSPAMVAHLGGPALDPLSYYAGSSASPESSAFREALRGAQRGEQGVLQRGVTAMSGIADNPANRSAQVLERLEGARAAGAQGGYPKVYDGPPLRNKKILDIIRGDEDLSEALTEGIDVMRREQQVKEIQGGASRAVQNPLDARTDQPRLTPQGELFRKLHPDVSEARLIEKGFGQPGGGDVPELPMQALDYMKQGADIAFEKGVKKGRFAAHDANLIRQKVEAILSAADADVPEYGAVRGRYAEQSRQLEGAEQGVTALSRTGPGIAEELANLGSDAPRDAYRTTATSTLRDEVRGKRYDANVSDALFNTPERDEQLTSLFGREGRAALDPFLEQGRALNRVQSRVAGGSETAPRTEVVRDLRETATDDASSILTSPRRSIINIPDKIADVERTRVQSIMRAVLAKELGIPANSPELPALVERLYQARAATNTTPLLTGRGLGLPVMAGSAAARTVAGGFPQ